MHISLSAALGTPCEWGWREWGGSGGGGSGGGGSEGGSGGGGSGSGGGGSVRGRQYCVVSVAAAHRGCR